ncbi:hypothetical protein LZC95_51050 [Pendulispora brunnea]|uniref:SMP-30/Gluconolactonase/LRE-like region domain-containing protein n=1 Tax=Pendulispora brunnea TaxID=2905690 RepID=A0ABZ2KBI9_9BACT
MTSQTCCAAAFSILIGCASTSPPPPLSGFAAPESVLYDPKGEQYFVSNIQGDPFAVDHDGFISRVAPDGTLIALRFIDGRGAPDGLSAPKGTALVGRTLYVADIDRVRLYDADTGQSRGAIVIPGANFLNDVDAAPDGTVYVTDSAVRREGTLFVPNGTEAVYALEQGKAPRQIAHGDLGSPNGIAWNDGKLEIVTLVSGEWITLSLSGEILQRSTLPTGMLDGVVKRENGELLISSWNGPAIYSVRAGAASKTLFANTLGADIGYDPKRARLLLPNMTENTVSFVPIPH